MSRVDVTRWIKGDVLNLHNTDIISCINRRHTVIGVEIGLLLQQSFQVMGPLPSTAKFPLSIIAILKPTITNIGILIVSLAYLSWQLMTARQNMCDVCMQAYHMIIIVTIIHDSKCYFSNIKKAAQIKAKAIRLHVYIQYIMFRSINLLLSNSFRKGQY